MIDGELAHSAAHGSCPHRIKVCVVAKSNSTQVKAMLSSSGRRQAQGSAVVSERFEAAKLALEGVPMALLSARADLGVTLLQLEGLDQSTVAVVAGAIEELRPRSASSRWPRAKPDSADARHPRGWRGEPALFNTPHLQRIPLEDPPPPISRGKSSIRGVRSQGEPTQRMSTDVPYRFDDWSCRTDPPAASISSSVATSVERASHHHPGGESDQQDERSLLGELFGNRCGGRGASSAVSVPRRNMSAVYPGVDLAEGEQSESGSRRQRGDEGGAA